ncbi:hypothetical protein PAXINDRAFT_117738 [Paxillus involutus ATCC 200175]|uniref:UDENN domain-containing protein n=1 Tax=Paxillus involutus ATCC 200175 TaxID=664439 RepID=A0A0C9SUK8_PAXIN|nr:hypothetical protein PAXINDRAFT_117738 [Paxillus involutus ATCC 200175]
MNLNLTMMSPAIQVPQDLEEQDIGLYYPSRRSSLSLSNTEASGSTSRQASQARLEIPLPTQHLPSPMKSPSLSNVSEVQQERRLSTHKTISRSKTLPQLASNASRHENGSTDINVPSFDFPQEKGLRMREWVLAFVFVQFDLDLGPVVRAVHPPMYLSPSERENIAFSSFPDSLQFEQGTEVHSFRIRVYPKSSEEVLSDHLEQRPQPLDGFLYGFSHFCQKKDPTSKRGYRQSSLVLLTQHQYPALFTCIISKVGPLFQSHGVTMLETACHNIASWQSPLPGSTIELGFLGSVLHVELPLSPDSQQLTETGSFNEKFDPAMHLLASSVAFDPPPINLFEASLSHLWSLWECLVLCEPILVYGPSPSMTSQAVWWLRDLIRPIPLAGDIRPYFTIHDKDHSFLVNKAPPKAGLVIGVTNPFFEKSCAHWPHVLSVGRKSNLRQGTTTVVAGPSPGWTTKTHRRHISKDRQLLKYLEKACVGNDGEST